MCEVEGGSLCIEKVIGLLLKEAKARAIILALSKVGNEGASETQVLVDTKEVI